MNRRIVDPGQSVLRIGVESVRFVCASGHEWVMSSAAIRQAREGAEQCPVCGMVAVDASIDQQSRVVERRGVVVELRAGDSDA